VNHGEPGSWPANLNGAGTFQWAYEPRSGAGGETTQVPQSGITYQHSEIKLSQVTDGTSKTLMLGERYINPDFYLDGNSPRDDQNIFVGHDRDVNGYTYRITFNLRSNNPQKKFTYVDSPNNHYTPEQDRAGWNGILEWQYGSAHPAGIHVVFCDGAVDSVAYGVDPKVFCYMGGRDDEVHVSQ
jgi:hypothetical protein